MATIRLHHGDLPCFPSYGDIVAVDTETLGLNPHRDRLCVVQLSAGDEIADLVQIPPGGGSAANLIQLLVNPKILKIFHYARFDLAILYKTFGVIPSPVYCTKLASKLARTYTDRHGLKDLVRDLLNIEISKHQQSSDWGSEILSQAQMSYAASDVLYLHELRLKLNQILEREQRMELAESCFHFLPTRAKLDVHGWLGEDLFAHS